jgi:hypothetical protein
MVKENSTGKHASVHVSRMKKAVERDSSLMQQNNVEQLDSDIEQKHNASNTALSRLIFGDGELNNDAGVHNHTRTQRQQRQQQEQQPDAPRIEEEEELEEGEIPSYLQ